MEEDWNYWTELIKTRVKAAKSPLTPDEINLRVKLLKGIDLPYEKFQFKSMEEMLRKMPGLFAFRQKGQLYIQASYDEKHIPAKEVSKISTLHKSLDMLYEKYIQLKSQTTDDVETNVDVTTNKMTSNTNDDNCADSKVASKEPEKICNPSGTLNVHDQSVSTLSTAKICNKRKLSPNNTSYVQQKQESSQSNNNFVEPQQQGADTSVIANSLQEQYLNIYQNSQNTSFLKNDPRFHLYCYTQAKNLSPPQYKHLPIKNQNIIAVVTIENKKYSSYPNETVSKEDAEIIAANHALQDLLEQCGTNRS